MLKIGIMTSKYLYVECEKPSLIQFNGGKKAVRGSKSKVEMTRDFYFYNEVEACKHYSASAIEGEYGK